MIYNNNKDKYSYQRLKDYALWYYFRYYPSNNKLIFKLKEKSSEELSKKVFEEIKHLFNEEEIIITKIRNYLLKNKNLNYIKQKLFEKMFDKDLILTILERDFIEDDKSLLKKSFIYKKIQLLKSKWKSKSFIINSLVERKEDRELVNNIIIDIFWDEWDYKAILFEYTKLSNKFDNKKIIEKLLRKWFKYNDIIKVIN